MTTPIQQFIESWLFDPTVGKLVSASVAILIVMALVRIGKGVLTRTSRNRAICTAPKRW